MAKKRNLWPRRARRIVQALAFLLFLVFIIRAPSLAAPHRRADWLMRFSPFSGLGASISAWDPIAAFWPALILLVGALVLGRYFCGWACPLGTTFDVVDRVAGRGPNTRKPLGEEVDFEHRRGRRVKYYLLAGSLAAAFVGVSAFGLLDPLSIATRSYVLVVHSYLTKAVTELLAAVGLSGAAEAAGSFLGAEAEPLFQLHLLTLLVLLGLLGLELVRPRFWCRYLCPLGALYALAGKAALTKRRVGEKCIECGRCAEICPMDCISRDGHRTLNGECILCLDCQAVCPTQAVSFFGRAPSEQKAEVDLTRRGALAAVAAGALTYPLYRLNPAAKRAKGDPLIRPPLAGRDIDEFLSKCLRCGQCMRVCPTQVIQPAGMEAGLEGLWTPRLVPRLGYCVYECDACGKACPSGAIPAFDLEEKHRTAMGLAYLDRTRCIPWRGDQRRDEEGFVADKHNCGVCEEVCPVPGKAIHFRRVYPGAGGGRGEGRREGDRSQELRLPYVRQDSCVGCGFCESACPVQGKAAVRVTGGFRELPEPPAAAAKAPETAEALPEKTDGLRLAGPKTTYTGGDELFEYINGGADPYLTFNFVRVTNAQYTDGANKLSADLWEFETPEDAFGAFAKDRRGEVADIGEEASMQGASLWAWAGRYMLAVLDMGETPPARTRELAYRTLEALDAEPASRPEICRRLPEGDLKTAEVLFMRDAAPLFNVKLAENWIPDGTFGITGGAVGAYGPYDVRSDDLPAALLLVRHPRPAPAREAAERLAKLRREWGDEEVAGQPWVVFRASEANYCAIGREGDLFGAAFFMPTRQAAEELLERALR